jgi:putative sigma-54 modulation protein
MNIELTGRNIEITPALRRFTSDKLRKLERLLDGPVEAHVVLVIEKHRHRAEIQIKSRTAVLSGTEETGDLYASIGEVAEKLERQALKHKEKVTERKRREATKLAAAATAPAKPLRRRRPTRTLVTPPAVGEETPTRLIRTERYRLKPLAPEDAALELEGTGEELLVFRDSRTYRVNVVYRRRDGNFGLVDPEF